MSFGVLCRDATEMTYFKFIESRCAQLADQDFVSQSVMFRNVPVSSSGFYVWRKRMTGQGPSAASQRRSDLSAKIATIYKGSVGTYGAPRVTAELPEGGDLVTEKTVAWIMTAHGSWDQPTDVQGAHDGGGPLCVDSAGPGEPPAPVGLRGR